MATTLDSVLARFDRAALEHDSESIYAVDVDLRLQFVNRGYRHFASRAGAEALLERYPLGACIVDAFREPERGGFERDFTAMLPGERPFTIEYECPIHPSQRLYRAMIYPLDGHGLLFVHAPVLEVAWTEERIAGLRDEDDLLHMCAGCKRVRHGEDWRYVAPLLAGEPEMTSHGLCEPCVGYYMGPTGAPSA